MLEPILDYILVDYIYPSIAINGIVISTPSKARPDRGKVLAVGTGRTLKNGDLVPLSIKKNDIVLFNGYIGEEVEVDGKKFKFLRESEILGKLEE
jgi:chaperonin GroES